MEECLIKGWWLGRCRSLETSKVYWAGSVLDRHILTAHLKASEVGNRVGSGYWWAFSNPDTSKSHVPIADTWGHLYAFAGSPLGFSSSPERNSK